MANFLEEAWSGIAEAPMGVKLAMGGAVAVAGFLGYRQYQAGKSGSVSNGQGLPLTGGDASTQTTAGVPASPGWLSGNAGTGITGGTTPPGPSGNPLPIPPVAPPVGPIQPSAVSVGVGQAIYQGMIPRYKPLSGHNGMA